jgi:hypothetical protein
MVLIDKEMKAIENVLTKTTPLEKYDSVKDWYEDFKKQMRKEIRDAEKQV